MNEVWRETNGKKYNVFMANVSIITNSQPHP